MLLISSATSSKHKPAGNWLPDGSASRFASHDMTGLETGCLLSCLLELLRLLQA